MPPARGYIAASSPEASAPRTVMTPVRIQAMSSQPGDPSVRPMSAATMKTPEPIMLPATSMVASVSVSALTNSGLEAGEDISEQSYWPGGGYGRESGEITVRSLGDGGTTS